MNSLNTFKIHILAVFLCCAAVAKAADDDDENKTVDIGGKQVGIFKDTFSPDRRYAAGCYDEAEDCIVDFKKKKILRLPCDQPYIPPENHASFAVSWGPEVNGRRQAFVENEARFYTDNLWLVAADATGMTQKEIASDLDASVRAVAADKRPLSHSRFEISFPVVTYTDDVVKGAVVYHEKTAEVPFSAEIPRSMDDNALVEGTVTVRLGDGSVENAGSDAARDDPFASDQKLRKADEELNKTYAALLHALTPARAGELKNEQRKWIEQRNDDADTAGKEVAVAENSDSDATADTSKARNKSLLESTQKRTAELKSRLSGH